MTIAGLHLLASFSSLIALFNHILHYYIMIALYSTFGGHTSLLLMEMPCFIINFYNILRLKLLLAVTLNLPVIIKTASP